VFFGSSLSFKRFFPLSQPFADSWLLTMGKRAAKPNLATQRTDLHAPPPDVANGGGGDPVDPPKRVLGKTRVGSQPPPPKKLKTVPEEMPAYPPFELCWGNFKEVMKHYQLTEQDTTKLLLEVVGPDPRGSSFWSQYADRIKREQVERETPPADLPPILPDNQMGDPTIFPPDVPPTDPEDEDYVDEGEEGEEEPIDGDPIDESVEVPANGGGDDDQDSPASGGVTTTLEVKEQICTPQPGETVEPIRTNVVVDKAVVKAKEILAGTAVASVPTPLKKQSSRVVQRAVRAPDDDLDDNGLREDLRRQHSFRLLGEKDNVCISFCFD